MEVDFIYFDFADTLVHKPRIIAEFIAAFAAEGHQVSAEAVRRAHRDAREAHPSPPEPEQNYYDRLNTDIARRLGIEANAELREQIYRRLRTCDWEPFEDSAVLATLARPLGVASNWRRGLAADVARLLPQRFRAILGSGDEGVAKPDPMFFRRAAEIAAVPPERILFVGDSPSLDCLPARAAGMQVLLVDRYGFYGDAHFPSVRSLRELLQLVPAGDCPQSSIGSSSRKQK